VDFAPDIEQLASVGREPFRLRHRAVQRRETPAIGKRVRGHIHDADEDG